MHKTLLFCYDTKAVDGREKQLEAFVKNNRHVIQWSLLFPGCYVLKSYSSASDVSSGFYEYLDRNYFVMSEIQPIKPLTNGSLQPEIWEWIKSDIGPSLLELNAQ